ncbi:MAG: hypothetical protein OXH76_20815 [Boseongicola sp.]|nr:hypothetical protein [Boseongicola sp.]
MTDTTTAPALSNRMADLAERAGEAFRLGRARSVEAAQAYLDCGAILTEAKAECGHGQWLPFLERAGIPARTATRMMKLAASGMDAESLAEKGIKAASEDMARPGKSATVADLEPSQPKQTRRQALRAERKVVGLCTDCGAPADGKTKCEKCRTRQLRGERQRRASGRAFEAIRPKLEVAANAGKGLTLSARDVAAIMGGRNA